MKNSLSHLVKTKTRQNTLSSLIRLSSATEKKLKQKRDVKSLSLKPKIRLQAKRKLFKLNVSGFQCKSRKSLHLWSLLRQSLFLKRGHLRHTFVYFWSFHNFCNIFFKKVFLELGVEITTSWTRVSSHYHYNKPLGEHCLYLHTMIPKPLFGCVKKLAVAQMAKLLLTAQEIRGWIYQCNCQ